MVRHLKEKIIGICLVAGLAFVDVYAGFFVNNYAMNNFENTNGNNQIISKSDWALGYTKFSKRYFEEEVIIHTIFDEKTAIDKNKDGGADEIKIEKIGYRLEATREKDYEQYKKEFDEADKLLRETKKRFFGE